MTAEATTWQWKNRCVCTSHAWMDVEKEEEEGEERREIERAKKEPPAYHTFWFCFWQFLRVACDIRFPYSSSIPLRARNIRNINIHFTQNTEKKNKTKNRSSQSGIKCSSSRVSVSIFYSVLPILFFLYNRHRLLAATADQIKIFLNYSYFCLLWPLWYTTHRPKTIMFLHYNHFVFNFHPPHVRRCCLFYFFCLDVLCVWVGCCSLSFSEAHQLALHGAQPCLIA